ncbi:alpha/beta hydrolase [Niabella soli DSM 19437]|uniref:Alpha/beta hydrolase n=2 Tax=Niabella TaxID=379899 RepID=W0F578_9BACT|nr:alpha/beta hydrolase [Niabella soli DSM 19437]
MSNSLPLVFKRKKAEPVPTLPFTEKASPLEHPISLTTSTGKIAGTLTLPEKKEKAPVVLFIAGSGPTDRNGNNNTGLKTNCTLQLARALAAAGIASVRYDKRGIAESRDAGKPEADGRFEDNINDAKAWLELLKKDNRFSKIIVAGHSEGSLIGMEAANGLADQFISIAGAGEPADQVLKKQLANLPDSLRKEAYSGLDSLKNGHLVHQVSPQLFALLRPSVQPYLASWLQYDPQAAIKKLKIPALIVQGTKDMQLSVADAQNLKKAQPKSELVIIENMNHVLKDISGGQQENMRSYARPDLPVDTTLVKTMIDFILK